MPNFEALGVPNSKRQALTHTQTDGRTTPHRPIVKDFFETFTKMNEYKHRYLKHYEQRLKEQVKNVCTLTVAIYIFC